MAMVALVLLAAHVSVAQDEYPVYVYPCPRAETAPTVDGVPEEGAWNDAPLVSGFTLYNKPEELAPVQTSFRVLHDERRVYFGVVCDEPLADDLAPVRTARDDGHVFRQEAVEFFVDPGHDHTQYHQFAVSAAGGLYDSRRTDKVWNSDAETAARIGEGQWSLELAIPWGDLGVTPQPGMVIGFNVCRDREVGRTRQWTNWSQTKSNFHDPIRFAHLVLSPTSEQLGQLGDEFRKGYRTGPLRIFGSAGFSEGSYRQLAEQALEALHARLRELDAAREQEAGTAAMELTERIAAQRRQVDEYRAQIEGKQAMDAATWVQMELQMRQLAEGLEQVVWEARLAALLAGI
jgi:hypothetical protein